GAHQSRLPMQFLNITGNSGNVTAEECEHQVFQLIRILGDHVHPSESPLARWVGRVGHAIDRVDIWRGPTIVLTGRSKLIGIDGVPLFLDRSQVAYISRGSSRAPKPDRDGV